MFSSERRHAGLEQSSSDKLQSTTMNGVEDCYLRNSRWQCTAAQSRRAFAQHKQCNAIAYHACRIDGTVLEVHATTGSTALQLVTLDIARTKLSQFHYLRKQVCRGTRCFYIVKNRLPQSSAYFSRLVPEHTLFFLCPRQHGELSITMSSSEPFDHLFKARQGRSSVRWR